MIFLLDWKQSAIYMVMYLTNDLLSLQWGGVYYGQYQEALSIIWNGDISFESC